jgi:hypothetical protein
MEPSLDPELEAAAEEELALAAALFWRDLVALTPWGDSFEGFGPCGGAVVFERSYLWNDEPGGDILCEVTAYRDAARYRQGVRRTCLIPGPSQSDRGSAGLR